MQGNNEKYYNLETESKSGTHTVHLEYKWTALNYWLKERNLCRKGSKKEMQITGPHSRSTESEKCAGVAQHSEI